LERIANLAKAQNAVSLAARMVSLQAKKAAPRQRGSVHRSSVLPPEDTAQVLASGQPGKRKGKQKGRPARKAEKSGDKMAEGSTRAPEVKLDITGESSQTHAKRGPSGRIYHNRCKVKLVKCFDTGCSGAITQVALVSGTPLLVVASIDCALTIINTETTHVLTRMGYVGEFPGSWPTEIFEDPSIPPQPMNIPRPTRNRTLPKHRFNYVFPEFVQSGAGEVVESLSGLEQMHVDALEEAVSALVSDLTPRSRRRGTTRRLAQERAAAAAGISLPALNQRPSSAVPHPEGNTADVSMRLTATADASDQLPRGTLQQRRSASVIPQGAAHLEMASPPKQRASTAMAMVGETEHDPEGERDDEARAKEEEMKANQKRLQKYLNRTRHRRRKRMSPTSDDYSPLRSTDFPSEMSICTADHAPSDPLDLGTETDEEAEVGFAGQGVLQKIQKANEQVTQLLKNMQKRRGPTRCVPTLSPRGLKHVTDDLSFPKSSPRIFQDQCRWVPPGHQQPDKPCKHCRKHRNAVSPHADDRLPEFERELNTLWTRTSG